MFFCDAGSIIKNNKIQIAKTTEAAGDDASAVNAFPVSETLIIALRAPRRTGVVSVTLRIAKDGGDDMLFPFSLNVFDTEEDIFSLSLNLSQLYNNGTDGLFFYDIETELAGTRLYTDTLNNVDFRLSKAPGHRFTLLIYSEDYKTPDWFKNSVMYHIFVDRFAKGGRTVKTKRKDAVINSDWENGIPQYAAYPGAYLENNEFFGGTLWGVAEKLDYLASLSVGTIYLSPIFKAYSNHKYDTGDYLTIDEMFGGEKAFSFLVREAGKRGMRILLDGVFNHTGDDSLYFNRYGTYKSTGAYQSESSFYRRWYTFREDGSYECWWGIVILPRLNHSYQPCMDFFTGEGGVAQYYIEKGITGWRLDVADELSDPFLDSLRKRVKAANPDAVIIGEVWENAADKISYGERRRYLRGAQLDSVMNYPFRSALLDYLRTAKAALLADELKLIYSSYPKCAADCLMNIVGTHDTERILTVLGGEEAGERTNAQLSLAKLSDANRQKALELLKLASTIQYTVYGIPSVFYGDETGLEGYRDPFCRRPFPWGREEKELLEHYRALGKIRTSHKAFDGGSFKILKVKSGLIVYERASENRSDVVTIAANAGKSAEKITLSGSSAELFSGATVSGSAEIPPFTAMIFHKE